MTTLTYFSNKIIHKANGTGMPLCNMLGIFGNIKAWAIKQPCDKKGIATLSQVLRVAQLEKLSHGAMIIFI